MPPERYVQALPVPTHGDSIPPGLPMLELDGSRYPSLVRALDLIRQDNGGPSWPPVANPMIPERWREQLDGIERGLAGLSYDGTLDCELWTFAAGEHEDVQAIANRSPELRAANELMNDFFEGWLDSAELHNAGPREEPQHG